MAGVVGVLAAVALIAAPAALASTTNINAVAGAQFSGVVDSLPECTAAPTGVTINWGDGASSPGTYDATNNDVTGTHTYASAGSYPNGSVVFTGGTSCATDTVTATVAPPPQFPQCPPVDQDTGCQFLITASDNGTTIANDASQTAYEGADDSLIGIVNNSSAPITSVPLSAPSSAVLFGFEDDGICNVTAPVPVGCQPIAGSPAGSVCGQGATCTFPAPPGQPAGYVEPGNIPGSTQNSYEGPTTWFSNVSADTSTGVVNFSPALQPGQSTYFSLEEPPVNTLAAGGGPQGGTFASPPTVTATGASFSALVNPNGSPTTAYFQYGLDLKYSKLGASGPNYTNSTAPQAIGGNFATHFVTASVSGLVPNALYHARLVASNNGGTTFGPDITFSTKHGPVPGTPTLGKNFNISPVSGLILVKIHGVFIPLTEVTQIPKNTVINALNGTLSLVTAGGSHPAADVAAKKGKGKKGKTTTQSGTFGGAIFKISQATGGANKGLATLTIVENAFKGAPSYSQCTKHKAADATAAKASSKTLQLLKSSAKGKFSTKGKYSAATVLGTKWTVADRCDGTLTHDQTDSVKVTDFVHHKTITLHAGQSYLAKKP